ncbi:hypothetical protein [Natrononativus amylolyticus]|uniref:hypothetical protein n=1 Tax=Natrononativus amylolyticus TaxID=2963434 RepID=UPI0020CCEE3E|nr:hypothetical protein [Natrononativus amylolyticus]
MIGTDALVAGCALLLAVGGGLVAHEWSHALALKLARVEYTVSYFPDRTDGVLAMLASCPWAAVHPQPTGREPPWLLRLAAMMPLVLALPVLVLGAAGSLPTDHAAGTAFVIGWLACTIPSPQDFSVAFYAHRALRDADDAGLIDTQPR